MIFLYNSRAINRILISPSYFLGTTRGLSGSHPWAETYEMITAF